MEYARRATYERGRNRQFVKDLIDVMIDGSWLWQPVGSAREQTSDTPPQARCAKETGRVALAKEPEYTLNASGLAEVKRSDFP